MSLSVLLADEHRALTAMLERLRSSHDETAVFCGAMSRHLAVERDELYPAALKALGERAEPAVAAMLKTDGQLLADLDVLLWSPASSELWDEALTRTESYLREHIRDCDSMLLRPLRSWPETGQEAAANRARPQTPRPATRHIVTGHITGHVTAPVTNHVPGRRAAPIKAHRPVGRWTGTV